MGVYMRPPFPVAVQFHSMMDGQMGGEHGAVGRRGRYSPLAANDHLLPTELSSRAFVHLFSGFVHV